MSLLTKHDISNFNPHTVICALLARAKSSVLLLPKRKLMLPENQILSDEVND